MKSNIRRWLGLAIVPMAALLILTLATPIHAQQTVNYKCQDDNNPLLNVIPTQTTESNPEQGNIIVDAPGDCTIPHSLHATGLIQIKAAGTIIINGVEFESQGSNIDIEAVNGDIQAFITDFRAARHIRLLAGFGQPGDNRLSAQDVIANTADITTGNANILLRAGSEITVRDIRTNGDNFEFSTRSGAVQIDVNTFGGSSIFEVGGSNVRTIDLRSLDGGGMQEFTVESGVRITNGDQNSTGTIKVSDVNAIQVKNSDSRAGIIHLNANKGTIDLAAGVLDASGTNNEGGGQIYLLADVILFNGDTTLTTNQTPQADGNARQILLAATTIDFTAASSLKILSDGDGGTGPTRTATIYFLPQGGIIPNSTDDFTDLRWTQSFNGNFFEHPGLVHFNGGTADLEIRSDGNNVQIAITGDDIIFDGNKVDIQAKGDHNLGKHEIVVGFFDFASYNGTKGLTFNTTDTVQLFARGEGQNAAGGDIQIQVDKTTLNTPKLNIKANGPASNSGDGGTIYYTTSSIDKANPDVQIKFLADASFGSTGNAQLTRLSGFPRKAIFFDAGDTVVPVGTAKGQYNFSATGGFTGGNGGAIEIRSNTTVRIRNKADVIDASALSDTGNGGDIFINANKTVFVQNSEEPTQTVERAIDASGGVLTGSGGVVTIPNAQGKNNGPINVNAVIHVNAGFFEPGSSFHGRIDLNTINCLQIRTANQNWPRNIWSCNSATQAAKIIEAANALIGQQPQLLTYFDQTLTNANPQVELYSMKKIDDYLKFFNDTFITEGINGLTAESLRVSAVFDSVNTQGGGEETQEELFGPTSIQASTIHELGHQLDYIWRIPFRHDAQDWKDARTNGLQQLDGLGVCTNVFVIDVCVDYVPGTPNSEILDTELDFSVKESFSHVFQATQSQPLGYSAGFDYESAILQMDQMETLMNGLVANPPAKAQ